MTASGLCKSYAHVDKEMSTSACKKKEIWKIKKEWREGKRGGGRESSRDGQRENTHVCVWERSEGDTTCFVWSTKRP